MNDENLLSQPESCDKGHEKSAYSSVRRPVNESRHLMGDIYTSPEIFTQEKSKIFLKDWFCVGRTEQIAEPGSYMTVRVGVEPVIITRDDKGEVHAMFNICRHRGVELASGSGRTRVFSCPYHNWTYDLTGKLIRAQYLEEMKPGTFDLEDCRLRPLSIETWQGWIFVNGSPNPPQFEDFVKEFEQAFNLLHMENCRIAATLDEELGCNWKFVNENFVDSYHFQTLHAESFGGDVEVEKMTMDLHPSGSLTGEFPARPSTMSSESKFGPMPWIKDQKDETFGCIGFLPPNFHIFGRYDMVNAAIILPISESRTRLIFYSLFPEKLFEEPDFNEKLKDYTDLNQMVLMEDLDMILALQRGVTSDRFVPGPMSLYEHGVHHLINSYLDKMF